MPDCWLCDPLNADVTLLASLAAFSPVAPATNSRHHHTQRPGSPEGVHLAHHVAARRSLVRRTHPAHLRAKSQSATNLKVADGMRATVDGSRSPPPLALPPRADRFQLWKRHRDRERREQRLGMAASPLSPPSEDVGSAEERRRARRVATHSEEEDELMDMIAERERQERETDGGKRLRHHLAQQQQQRQRRQLPPLSASALARARRFTVPMQTAEQPREDEPAPRRPYGSASRAPTGRSEGDEATGRIPINEINDRYAFQPASSLRWRSMKPPLVDDKDGEEQRRRRDEADADRMLELAAMDSGKRKDLWDNFYIGAKASHEALQQTESPVSPAVFSSSGFLADGVPESQSSVGSWGHQEALPSGNTRVHGKVGSSTQHSSTQSSGGLGRSPPDSGLRRRYRKNSAVSEVSRSCVSESGQSERALDEELPGLTVRKRGQEVPQESTSASALFGDGLFDPKNALGEIFPPWSVVFLASCVAAGVGGFFVEEMMEVAGIFFKTMPFSVSRAEQQRLHERLEGLQKELRGFRSAASEIDSHSHKVFEEVRRHLDKLRSERERHQDMVAKEMHELRRHVLQMTYEMVEQERQAIHQRLEETVGARLADKVISPSPSPVPEAEDQENSSPAPVEQKTIAAVAHRSTDATDLDPVEHSAFARDSTVKPEENGALGNAHVEIMVTREDSMPESAQIESAPVQDSDAPDRIRVDAVLAKIDQIVNGVESVDELPVPIPAPAVASTAQSRSPPRGLLVMSWQATLVLFAMLLLGGYVGLRLRSINRRRKWLDDRRRRRQRHRYFSPARAAKRAAHSDQSDAEQVEDEWEQAGSEYSVETVALMTPVNSGDEGDEEGFEPDERSELTSSAGSAGRSENESELDEQQSEFSQADADEYAQQGDRYEMDSDSQEETKGGEQDLASEWDEMEQEEEEEEDVAPPEFVHPSTEHYQEEAASNQAAVYRMATTEVRALMR